MKATGVMLQSRATMVVGLSGEGAIAVRQALQAFRPSITSTFTFHRVSQHNIHKHDTLSPHPPILGARSTTIDATP